MEPSLQQMIQALQTKAGMSQMQIATATGISQSSVCKIALGKQLDVHGTKAVRLLNLYASTFFPQTKSPISCLTGLFVLSEITKSTDSGATGQRP